MTWVNEKYIKKRLQVYRVDRPEKYVVEPSDAIHGLESWIHGGDSFLTIHKSATLQLDWGTERAAWLEFLSSDLIEFPNATIQASLSEFNSPYPGKTKVVTRYGTHTYRLETNEELYEGVRFTWIYIDLPAPPSTLIISNISLVAKVKPVDYLGSFESSHPDFTKIWYTGAYAVRLNMEEDGFNSILLERGDRVAIQGDGHPTMASALVAFQEYDLVQKMLNATNSGYVHGHHVVDESIMAYPIYWTISVYNWYMASGDTEGFLAFVPDIMSILDLRVNDFLTPHLDIGWMGWDDRLGNGWCFHSNHDECPREGHLTFAALVIRAVSNFAHALDLAGKLLEAQKYSQIVRDLSKEFRTIPEWPHQLGVHSATNAINAGLATRQEVDEWMVSLLNDSVSICSWSPFNQYWILQGLGNADEIEHALASIRLCWGSMLKITEKGCFFELYSPEWNKFRGDGDLLPTMPSYCHPWSSGVTEWMSHTLGGIEPLLPGFDYFVATPFVSEQYPSVSSVMPTPHGSITANATLRETNKKQTVVEIKLDAPVPGYVGFRTFLKGGCKVERTTLAGKPSAMMQVLDVDLLKQRFLPLKGERLRFVEIPAPGTHVIRVWYTGCDTSDRKASSPSAEFAGHGQNVSSLSIPHIPPFPQPYYPGSVELDSKRRGDGLHYHGDDGFILFGVGANATDTLQLPSYIANVRIQDHGFYGWLNLSRTYVGSSPSDPSYLPDGSTRTLGMIGHGDDTYWNPGLLIDLSIDGNIDGELASDTYPDQDSILVDVEKTEPTRRSLHDDTYSLSLYCVAASGREKFSVRAMDLDSLNVVSPTIMISDHEDGVWYTLRYHRSVRLRVMGIYGVHVSAIGFSTRKK